MDSSAVYLIFHTALLSLSGFASIRWLWKHSTTPDGSSIDAHRGKKEHRYLSVTAFMLATLFLLSLLSMFVDSGLAYFLSGSPASEASLKYQIYVDLMLGLSFVMLFVWVRVLKEDIHLKKSPEEEPLLSGGESSPVVNISLFNYGKRFISCLLWTYTLASVIETGFWIAFIVQLAHVHIDPKAIWLFVIVCTRTLLLLVHSSWALVNGAAFSVLSAPSTATTTRTGSPRPTTITWTVFGQHLKTLFPLMWPKTFKLKMCLFAFFVTLAIMRVINLLVPLQYKLVVEALSTGTDADGHDKRPYFAWGLVLVFVTLRFLQGSGGLIGSIQNELWLPLTQHTTAELSLHMMRHLHSLSLQYHVNKKTGELITVMNRGTSSVVDLLGHLVINILPVLFDIVIAIIYFVVTFDWMFGLIVMVTMSLYLIITIVITDWRTVIRRESVEAETIERGIMNESIINFETVKYFNNEEYEVQRYKAAIDRCIHAEWKLQFSLDLLNMAQNLVISLGLLAGCLVCAKSVADGRMSVGDFILYLSYILQLYQPLNFFGTYYRVIHQKFVDMESMMAVFLQKDVVKDAPDATTLVLKEGKIEFEHVSFSYDARSTALFDVSFVAQPGQTVALVGPTGGGKSTILRLLFRFYDPTEGQILVDGQDIKMVTQNSLRQHVGVVPQDTVLFNETIMYNIRYGKPDASDDEVIAAAKAAQIHENIIKFPDGYNTKVGERGLRLSGGEKQRVAIARTLLKNPSIMLLDEATSALDNQTERQIQATLQTIHTKWNATQVVIAHRLSTIVHADLILVVSGGRIVERGTHQELLAAGQHASKEGKSPHGLYYQMWMSQLSEVKHVARK